MEFWPSKPYPNTPLPFVGIDEFWEGIMQVGYARVNMDPKDHALQLDALRSAGCGKLFIETASGTRTDRPELAKALEVARKGDVLVVWCLELAGTQPAPPNRHR